MFRPGSQEIDAGGLDAGVAQHIGQLHNVMACPVKGRGEQVPEIVGKDFAGRDTRRPAQPLHLRPDLAAAEVRPVLVRKSHQRRFLLLEYFNSLRHSLRG